MIETLPNLTDEQQAAIRTRNVSIALSAGAGCGKTFVLTERFLSHLEPGDPDAPPADLHELVAITFTDRAAREMRDRIRNKCYERLAQATPQHADFWLRLLRSLETARISTIHSFCGALLRAHAVEAGLDPRFTVIEQTQADTLAAELIDDVLRERLAAQDKILINLIVEFGLDRLRKMIGAILAHGRLIDFERWLDCTPANLVNVWRRFHSEVAVPAALEQFVNEPCTRTIVRLIHLLAEADGELRRRRDELAQLIDALSASGSPASDLEAIFDNARVKGVDNRDLWPSDAIYNEFKDAATQVRKRATETRLFLDFDGDAAATSAQLGLDLLSVVQAVFDRCEQRKAELSWLDFNDLLTRARELLTSPVRAEIARQLSSQIRLLLVDECQDTDPVQVDLILALVGEGFDFGRLFFVGDFKQSIYRFRGADPGVFRALRERTPRAGQLPLSTNFRSQPAILQFVNALFSDVPLASGGNSMAYEPLQADRPQTTAQPAVEFLWVDVSDLEKVKAGAVRESRRREAEQIAKRIRLMLDRREEIVAEKDAVGNWHPRAVKKGDIAILFRALSDVQHYEEALRRWGIDYYLVGGYAFYAQQEIHDMVNLLRAIASPADQISLAGALRSPIFALDDETLFWLAQNSEGLSAGLFAQQLASELSPTQRERAGYAAAVLHELRGCKDRMPITDLLNRALALTGYDATLLGEFLGERKLANLRKLLEQARTFDAAGVMGLADFIVQLSEFVAVQPREALAATHAEDADVVRLMTIHQAKGLEFPVVFLPDIDRTNHSEDHPAVWHPQLGPLVRLSSNGDKPTVTGFDLYRAVNAAETSAEIKRMLYVATTRAADYLVLSAGLFEFDEPSAPWARLLADHFNLRTGQFRASARSKYKPVVEVTTTLPTIQPALDADRTHEKLSDAIVRAQQLVKSGDVKQESAALVYPIAANVSARRHFSVSRLSGQLERTNLVGDAGPEEAALPISGDAAAALGTVMHRALAQLNFAAKIDISASLQRLTDLAPQVVEHSPAMEQMLRAFIDSRRARSLAAARTVHRELEFLLAWPPAAELGGSPTRERLRRYLRGFIDCLYQDAAGDWHLLDYKTNRLAAENAAAAAGPYEMQLGIYALATEEILGRPPVELVVHFLRPSAEQCFRWDAEMRERVVEQVNQAIAALVNHPEQCESLAAV